RPVRRRTGCASATVRSPAGGSATPAKTDNEGARMAAKLKVLVLESDQGAADVAREELTAAGHVVLRCHEPGAPAFPCNALAKDQRCPLDAADVDVALDVR